MERNTNSDFFRVPAPDEKEISTNLKLLVDRDLENFRKRLWALEGEMSDIEKGYYWQPNAAPRQSPCSVRLSHVHTADAEPAELHLRLTPSVEGTPLTWNTSPPQKAVSSVEATPSPSAVQDSLESEPATAQKPTEAQSTTGPGAREELEDVLALPLTPVITAKVPEESISSISVDENISEDHRRDVARKQYYERSGVLWDCTAKLLEKHSLHPMNLNVYEFTKLVCIQGHEVFAWIETNRRFLVDRAKGQWLQANALLRNNANLNGLNANFMDDFLWMEPEHQVSFIGSYKRLQLEATALREGVKLPKSELDALCSMSDDEKLAVIHAYKEDGIKMVANKAAVIRHDNEDRESSEGPEELPVKADNLYLKFLHLGLGLEKSPQDLVGATKKVDVAQTADCAISAIAESFFRTADNVPMKISWASSDHDVLCNLSEASSSDTRVIDLSEPSHSIAPSLKTPQLQRHKSSYRDLRAFLYGNTSSEIYDEGSDCDFSPPKSLRRKCSKLLDTVKKSFTMSSIGRKRQPVKNYF